MRFHIVGIFAGVRGERAGTDSTYTPSDNREIFAAVFRSASAGTPLLGDTLLLLLRFPSPLDEFLDAFESHLADGLVVLVIRRRRVVAWCSHHTQPLAAGRYRSILLDRVSHNVSLVFIYSS